VVVDGDIRSGSARSFEMFAVVNAKVHLRNFCISSFFK